MVKFEEFESDVRIRDLKKLGREGGAIALLETGESMSLKAKHGTIKKKGYIAGELRDVEVVINYRRVFSAIRIIERNGILVAKKYRTGKGDFLKLTGRGYHRTDKRGDGNNIGK